MDRDRESRGDHPEHDREGGPPERGDDHAGHGDDHTGHGDGYPKSENDHSGREDGHAGHGYADRGSEALPGGLSVAANGLRLVPSETRLEAGVEGTWTFRIEDEEGEAVTEFERSHSQSSHLILVRRDLTRFRHLHPEMSADGTWSVDLALPDSGVYRAFVDVVVGGTPTTLGVDLFASGDAAYEPRPDSTRRATVDGYEIECSPEAIPAGEDVGLGFEVRRDGEPVADLGEYLGALGHLVALREGDLAYLHVHPEATDPGDGRIGFDARFPTAGRYRLFLQAKPEGRLVTASFDVRIDDATDVREDGE